MVTLWRERHGLCKSHFVERNWYMFPAKIFPAEIFPQFVQTQHSRTLPTDQKSKSPGRPGGRCYSNCSAASCRRDGLLLGTIESATPLRHATNNARRRSSNGGTGSNPIARLCLARPTFFKSFLQVNVEGWPLPSHNEINRALALMKCPGNEHLEGGAGSPAVTAAFDAVRSAAPDWRR